MKTPTSQTRPFLVYGSIILVLFLVMFQYSRWLEVRKERSQLGEATMGQVDSGSFMLKLALLGGARGVAANVLWTRAIDLQKVQEWDKLMATVNMITKLQPHFLSVWTFQGWNLAYNVSVEWDAPEDKYEWIKQGIKFLQDGVAHNTKSPDLIWDTAWTYYHKLGFADEAIVLRRLFYDDDDEKFKTDPLEHAAVRNDNFQLGRDWFTLAINLVDSGATRLAGGIRDSDEAEGAAAQLDYVDAPIQHKGRPDDLAFRSMPAHAQTRYAAGLEKQSILGHEATFGEKARNEWSHALDEWLKFGKHEFMSFNRVKVDGQLIHQPVHIDDVTNPEVFAKLHENQRYWTNRWSDQMNYRYWKDRSMAEMEPEGVHARQLFYEATTAYKQADFPAAEKGFAEGLKVWEKVLANHHDYREDQLNQKDTGLILLRYLRVLTNAGKPIPDDMPFKDLISLTEGEQTLDPFDAKEMKHADRP